MCSPVIEMREHLSVTNFFPYFTPRLLPHHHVSWTCSWLLWDALPSFNNYSVKPSLVYQHEVRMFKGTLAPPRRQGALVSVLINFLLILADNRCSWMISISSFQKSWSVKCQIILICHPLSFSLSLSLALSLPLWPWPKILMIVISCDRACLSVWLSNLPLLPLPLSSIVNKLVNRCSEKGRLRASSLGTVSCVLCALDVLSCLLSWFISAKIF